MIESTPNHNINLYNELTIFGSVYPLKYRVRKPYEFVEWTETNFDYVKYNPRKEINRFGLSITSLDGGVSGIPDLDSIKEYNRDNNTSYSEKDFVIHTPVYDHTEISKILEPIKYEICRSHILKLGPGGFFPAHRDFVRNYFDTFRLIIPLYNVNPPKSVFIIDNKIHYWKEGQMYFVDTAKIHYLFNASMESSYWIVVNAFLNDKTIDYVTTNMEYH